MANGLPASEAHVLAVIRLPIAVSALSDRSGVPAWQTILSWAVAGTADHAIPPALVQAAAGHQGRRHLPRALPGRFERGLRHSRFNHVGALRGAHAPGRCRARQQPLGRARPIPAAPQERGNSASSDTNADVTSWPHCPSRIRAIAIHS